MDKRLTIDAVMNEPRQIELIIEGRRLRFLPFLSTKLKQITLNIPNPSIRQAQVLRQKYYSFVHAYVNKNEKVLAKISMDIVADAFKSYRPIFTKWWVLRNLNDTVFTQILDFIFQPTKEQEEERLKNALTLQKNQQS